MKRLAFILVLVIALLTTSCQYITGEAPAQTPEPTPSPITSPPPPRTDWEKSSPPPAGIGGWEQPRPLSQDEKTEVIEIALSSQRVSEWLQGRSDYRTGPVDWYAIVWNSNGEAGTWWSLGYDRIANEGIPDFVNPYAFWYPGVTIAVGEGTIYQMQIAVDPGSRKAVMVMGPYPSLSSPDRFKNMLPPPPPHMPVLVMPGSSVDPEAPDALVPTPGFGPVYRANFHEQDVENPWPPIEISAARLAGDSDNVSISYREYIGTAAGESRNNIIRATTSSSDIKSMSLYAGNIPDGIKLTIGSEWSGPLSTNRSLLLVIEISLEVAPGQYPLEIGLEINGKDYGTIPCVIEVLE